VFCDCWRFGSSSRTCIQQLSSVFHSPANCVSTYPPSSVGSSASRLLLILTSPSMTLTSRNIKTTSSFSHRHFLPHSFLLSLFHVFLLPRGSPSIITFELCSYERVRWGWHMNRVNCPGLPALWLSGSSGLVSITKVICPNKRNIRYTSRNIIHFFECVIS